MWSHGVKWSVRTLALDTFFPFSSCCPALQHVAESRHSALLKKLFVAPCCETEHGTENLADKHFVVWNHGPENACHARQACLPVSSISKSHLNHTLWTQCLLIQHMDTTTFHRIFFSVMLALFGCYRNMGAFASRQTLSFLSAALWSRGYRFIPYKWHSLHPIRTGKYFCGKKIAVWVSYRKFWFYLPVQCLGLKLE